MQKSERVAPEAHLNRLSRGGVGGVRGTRRSCGPRDRLVVGVGTNAELASEGGRQDNALGRRQVKFSLAAAVTRVDELSHRMQQLGESIEHERVL